MKFVNHNRKIHLYQSEAEWFLSVIWYSSLVDLYFSGYKTISHGTQGAFAERCHKENSSFHFPTGEMTITLDDTTFLLHLPIMEKLLDHSRIKYDEAQEMMVIYLGAGPMDALMQCESTRGAHAKFLHLKKIYGEYLELAKEVDDDDL